MKEASQHSVLNNVHSGLLTFTEAITSGVAADAALRQFESGQHKSAVELGILSIVLAGHCIWRLRKAGQDSELPNDFTT